MAGEQVFVFDACAFIALLEDEPGAAVVEDLLQDPGKRCLIHAISACEIYYDLYRRGNTDDANSLAALLAEYGLELLEALPAELWRLPACSRRSGVGFRSPIALRSPWQSAKTALW